MTTGLDVRDLRVSHRSGPEVVRGVSLSAPRGAVTALIGPNGAGKTTLLRALVGLLPCSGSAVLDGADLGALAAPERARRVGYVPQRTRLVARMNVRGVVDLGRFAHRGAWRRGGAADREAVDRAMEQTGVAPLADRAFVELSGGEQQRVLLARALATGASALLLDEPTASLDVRHALELHALLRRLADDGAVVVVVMHDLGEVREHADHVVLLDGGKVSAAGPAADVVSADPIAGVYRVRLLDGVRPGYGRLHGGGVGP
ncbi:MAG: ABC transporter ATP-binding protein [Myxococcales bacterium]|nr:ABC transporter ATP-binding protein [Myxococcales bacterium]MCB9521529.1 ABC transporter ATP-binding protein [Myxococcales bacterium]MCB9534080.1 ABC transporter ATP-binding protein [Myxococcales bacterium]